MNLSREFGVPKTSYSETTQTIEKIHLHAQPKVDICF